MCKVVHCKKDSFDIYIGRPSKWGNPYSEKENTLAEFKCKTREEAIKSYETYLLSKPKLMNNLHELKYKTLVCWCKNKGGGGKNCHGDILKKYVDKLEAKDRALF